MTKKITNEQHRTRFNTRLKCLHELLAARMSTDGLCFIPGCKAEIKKFYRPLNKSRGFLCKNCMSHIHPTVDSIFHRTHIELSHWFEIAYRMLSSRNSVSSNEIFRDYAYGTNTIFYMMHDIRQWMGESLKLDFSNQVIEIDESYISTGNKGHNRHYGFKRGRGSDKHANILVMKARGGGIKLFKIPSSESSSIIPLIKEQIPTSSIIVTDEWGAYNELRSTHGYVHHVVNHRNTDLSKRYVDGIASTNNGENIFSWFKRAIKGTHVHIDDKYVANYLSEISFRLTYKDEPDYGFSILMKSLPPLTEHYSRKNAA